MSEFLGGCLCGGIRYRLDAISSHAAHCHCSQCRRASGAAFLTWVAFPAGSFAFTQGAPRIYQATDKAERSFCPDCGTPLTFRHVDSAHQVDVTAGSLDNAQDVQPVHHIWDSAKLCWLNMDDGLPRYPGERDGSEDML
jgi:hypothetical protein